MGSVIGGICGGVAKSGKYLNKTTNLYDTHYIVALFEIGQFELNFQPY